MKIQKNNTMHYMRSIFRKECVFLMVAVAGFSSCRKIFDLPNEKDYLSNNVNYSNKVFEPIIGRSNLMGGFNGDNSTQPIKFEIINARYGNGQPVTDLFQVRPTYVWKAAYTGLEKSLEEIEAKRKLEDHPLFEVRSSGEFIMWPSATNQLITPRSADSTNFPQDTRFFDLRLTNTGGTTVIRDFEVRPFRERPYEPSEDFNIYSGKPAPHPKRPYDTTSRNYIRPFLNGVIGDVSEKNLESNDDKNDVVVYIRPFTGGNGHSLRFKFLNTDSIPMRPSLFNETKWADIVHGFNMQKNDEYVQYDVAYPIPLVNIVTKYAPGGSRDHAEFAYSRVGFGGERVVARFGIDFAIYQPGDWEIVFHFKKENPKFKDE